MCVTKIIKMKWIRSLNTTKCLLSKMESTYVTTCFGLHLWPSSGYNLVALRVFIQYMLKGRLMMRYHPSEKTRLDCSFHMTEILSSSLL